MFRLMVLDGSIHGYLEPFRWAEHHGDGSVCRTLQWPTSIHRRRIWEGIKARYLLPTRIPSVYMTNFFQPSPNPYFSAAPLHHLRNQSKVQPLIRSEPSDTLEVCSTFLLPFLSFPFVLKTGSQYLG